MRVLLDTHAFLWFAWGDVHLSGAARSLIEEPTNRKFVSMASIWEMSIKSGQGKLALAKPINEFLRVHLDGNGFDILPIERQHAVQIERLPLHHRDPFDRLLIAQGLAENRPLLSADPLFDAYGTVRLW